MRDQNNQNFPKKGINLNVLLEINQHYPGYIINIYD